MSPAHPMQLLIILKYGVCDRQFRLLRVFATTICFIMLTSGGAGLAWAQPAAAPSTAAADPGAVPLPGFWDPRRRPERPDLGRMSLIRFLTENDYPPFNYPGPDGNPAGFNVDLARMICEELKIACTVQMRRFDTLIDSLNDNRGDAVKASIAVTPET